MTPNVKDGDSTIDSGIHPGARRMRAFGVLGLCYRSRVRYDAGGRFVPLEAPSMTENHFDQALAAFQQRSPFRPFTVVLGSGTRFEIDHPGALIFREGVAVFLGPGGVPILFDHEGVEQFVADLAGQSS